MGRPRSRRKPADIDPPSVDGTPTTPTGWNADHYQRLVAGYLEFLDRHRGLTARTQENHHRALRAFGAFLAARSEGVGECTVATVDEFVQEVSQRGRHRNTLQACLGALRGFFRWLLDEGQVGEDLAAAVETPRVFGDSYVPRSLPWQQVQQLISVVGQLAAIQRDRAIILLLTTYGLRSGEVRRLRVGDVDLTHGRFVVRERKNGQPLHLPLLPAVREALQSWLGSRPAVEDRWLFVHPDGRPLGKQCIHGIVRRWGRLAGLKNVNPVMLRHSLGRHLMEQQVDIVRIGRLLGHTTIEATQTYVRISLEQLRDVADNYAELLVSHDQ